MMKKVFTFFSLFAAFTVMMTVTAFATYIDPSAVTYTAQAIAAVVVALGALITVFRHKIAALFKKNKVENVKREIHVVEDEVAELSVDSEVPEEKHQQLEENQK